MHSLLFGGRMPGKPSVGACLVRTSIRCLGDTASLGLSACIACIPSWPGTSAAHLGRGVTCLGRADCLGESTCQLGFECLCCLPSSLAGGSTVYPGRIVNYLGNSSVRLGTSPWLRISTFYLRGVASPD